MAQVIVTRTLENRIKNDTSNSVNFTFSNLTTGVAIDLTGITAQCQFRYNTKLGSVVLDATIGSGLTLTDAANGILTLDEITSLGWEIGCYKYDVQITFPTTKRKTYVQGTLTVLQDTTHT